MGAFAVDYKVNGSIKTDFFKEREDAIRRMVVLGKEAYMRDTTLEDVFIEGAGKKLGN